MTSSDRDIGRDEPGSALRILRFQRPSLPPAASIEHYLSMSRADRWFANSGPCWRLLRDRMSERVGAFCVPVANGTIGLMAAIAAVLDAGGGSTPSRRREALLPSFTFPATLQAATWAGLSPRLLDVDLRHWHLDPVHLAHELKARRDDIAVVIAVSSFGTPAPASVRQAWERACAEADVPLIMDSAAGFGAVSEDGTPIGAQGDAEVVSFHATKPFAIGEGGAVFTRSDRLRARLESVVNFGFTAERTVEFASGFNGKMSELHAATGLAVLDGFDAALDARRRAVGRVQRQIHHRVSFQAESSRSTWQFIPVAFPSEIERLDAEKCCEGVIEVRTYYTPLHTMLPFRQLPVGDLGVEATDDLVARLLCLPMAADIADDEVDQIAAPLLDGREALP